MTLPPRVRQILLVIVCVLLLGLAWIGLSGGLHQLSQSRTPGQMVQTLTQFGFGVSALLSLVTTFRAQRLNPLMLVGWVISLSLAAGLASVVWGDTSLWVGLVAGSAALVIGLGIAWLVRVVAI
jgi:TRAP-type C4-dicarboxylate transport system permease small subunit